MVASGNKALPKQNALETEIDVYCLIMTSKGYVE